MVATLGGAGIGRWIRRRRRTRVWFMSQIGPPRIVWSATVRMVVHPQELGIMVTIRDVQAAISTWLIILLDHLPTLHVQHAIALHVEHAIKLGSWLFKSLFKTPLADQWVIISGVSLFPNEKTFSFPTFGPCAAYRSFHVSLRGHLYKINLVADVRGYTPLNSFRLLAKRDFPTVTSLFIDNSRPSHSFHSQSQNCL